MTKKNHTVTTECPNCGNEIEVSAREGEIRRCPYCRWHYRVKEEYRKRKVLEEYIKVPKKRRTFADPEPEA